MKKIKICLVLTIISLFIIVIPINITGDQTDTEGLHTSEENSEIPIPTSEFIDYENGTTEIITDYHNGTIDVVRSTFSIDYAQIEIGEETLNQAIDISIPTSTEECTDWIPVTQRVVFDPKITMGFRYDLVSQRLDILNANALLAYCKVTIVIEVAFGLILPVDITIEYPEQMTEEHYYTWYATLTPINDPTIEEFKCSIIAGVELKAGVCVIIDWLEYSEFFGVDLDKSQDFVTPVGPGDSFPIGSFGTTLLNFWLLKIKLMFTPQLTSQKITAAVNCDGDSSGSHTLTWTDGGQKIPFTVYAADFDANTHHAKIKLSDFRYYFTYFKLSLGLKFDLDPWIDWLTGNPEITLFTLNLSFLLGDAYLGVHQGPSTINVDVFVKKFAVKIHITPLSEDIEPGHTGVYNVYIQNNGNVEDEFILSLTGLPPPPWMFDFDVNPVVLGPGAYTNIQLSISPYRHYTTSPGDYSFRVTATSQRAIPEGLSAVDTADAYVHVLSFYEVDIAITPETDSVVPGETVDYSINIRNLGNVHDTFSISTSGIDPNWLWELSTESVTLDPNCETNVQLSIIPYRHYSTALGDYPFDVIVSSEEASDTEIAIVHILPFYDVDLIITPVHASTFPSGSVTYQLDVRNYGNDIDGVIIDFDFVDFYGDYRVYPTVIQESWVSMPLLISGIAPGAIGTEYLTIAAPFDWAGMEDAIYEFITTVTSIGDSLVNDNENAYITFESTLESRIYYLNYEMELLQQSVLTSSIEPSIIESLNDHLEAAIHKKEQAHQNIIDGKIRIVDNRLATTMNIMEAFINLVEAQCDKYIPSELATIWIESANAIIFDLDATISYVLYRPPTTTSVNTGSNSYYTLNYLMILMILGSIVILLNFRKKIYLI